MKRASMIVLSVLATTLVVWAQSSTNLQALQSSDPAVRMQAFYVIAQVGTPMDDATRLALIGLLNTETQYLSTLTGEDDTYATYYSNVVTMVASLQDVRALNALVNLIHSGSIVTDALASFGPPALDPLLAKLKNSDPRVTTGAVITMNAMLSPQNLSKINDPVSLNKLRVGFETAGLLSSPVAQSLASKGTAALLTVFVPGDLDGDGKVDCGDIAIVKASFGKRTGQIGFDPRADVNLDGIVDIRDLAFVSQHLPAGTKCP